MVHHFAMPFAPYDRAILDACFLCGSLASCIRLSDVNMYSQCFVMLYVHCNETVFFCLYVDCLEVEINTIFCGRKMVKLCCHKTCRNVRCMLDERSALSQRRLPRWRHLTVQVTKIFISDLSNNCNRWFVFLW